VLNDGETLGSESKMLGSFDAQRNIVTISFNDPNAKGDVEYDRRLVVNLRDTLEKTKAEIAKCVALRWGDTNCTVVCRPFSRPARCAGCCRWTPLRYT
jgi:hypothetical protein